MFELFLKCRKHVEYFKILGDYVLGYIKTSAMST